MTTKMKKMKQIKTLLPAAAIFICTSAHLLICISAFAQPGSLDTTFSSDGKVSTAIGSNNDGGRSVAIQTEGKIVVADYYKIVVNFYQPIVIYKETGKLNNLSDGDGKLT